MENKERENKENAHVTEGEESWKTEERRGGLEIIRKETEKKKTEK